MVTGTPSRVAELARLGHQYRFHDAGPGRGGSGIELTRAWSVALRTYQRLVGRWEPDALRAAISGELDRLYPGRTPGDYRRFADQFLKLAVSHTSIPSFLQTAAFYERAYRTYLRDALAADRARHG